MRTAITVHPFCCTILYWDQGSLLTAELKLDHTNRACVACPLVVLRHHTNKFGRHSVRFGYTILPRRVVAIVPTASYEGPAGCHNSRIHGVPCTLSFIFFVASTRTCFCLLDGCHAVGGCNMLLTTPPPPPPPLSHVTFLRRADILISCKAKWDVMTTVPSSRPPGLQGHQTRTVRVAVAAGGPHVPSIKKSTSYELRTRKHAICIDAKFRPRLHVDMPTHACHACYRGTREKRRPL